MNWALSWSQRQNALHIETAEQMLSNNRQAYRDDQPGDYRVLFIGPEAEVQKAADAIRATMASREMGIPG